MKKHTSISIVTAGLFVMTMCLQAQVTVIGHVTAEVVSILTATETTPLSFGQFSPETEGGQITLSPQGTRSATGTVDVVGKMHNAGTFYITGAPNSFISIQLPSGSTTLKNAGNSGTLIVTDWRSDPPQQSSVTIPRSGNQIVNVGATLLVRTIRDNPVGFYAGTYNITFNYN